MRKFRNYSIATAILLASLVTVGTSGAQTCSSDCGVHTAYTPADVAAARAEAKATGNWLGPINPNVVYDGGYSR